MKSYQRAERVAVLIHRELAALIQQSKNRSDFAAITLTGVELSPDLAHAKVFVSSYLDDKLDAFLEKLNLEAANFRHLLARKLNLRVTPELRFVADESLQHGRHISHLIDEALAADAERAKKIKEEN